MHQANNHSYLYQTREHPNQFRFTPEQVARVCLEHGRAKKSPYTVAVKDGKLVVTLSLDRKLIERACLADVIGFHGNASSDNPQITYHHQDDGGLLIEIQETVADDQLNFNDDFNKGTVFHDVYVCTHPRKEGYLVYDADSEWTAEGETEAEAISNWKAGKRTDQISFDRGELRNSKSVE